MNNTFMMIFGYVSVAIAGIYLGTVISILFYSFSLGGKVLIASCLLFVICFIIQIINIK